MLKRKARGQQQLVRLHPRQDVRPLHHVEAPDHPIETCRAGEHRRAAQTGDIQQVTHRQTVVTRWQHLRPPSLIVGNCDHRQTVPGSLASRTNGRVTRTIGGVASGAATRGSGAR